MEEVLVTMVPNIPDKADLLPSRDKAASGQDKVVMAQAMVREDSHPGRVVPVTVVDSPDKDNNIVADTRNMVINILSENVFVKNKCI
ncbi:hypothetical protein O3G_MSEX009761 [Manduca sexta]|uniref:Uncharacterized protein n=1 Tax=Manduca sexta TaxID=7130 RepID=A0A922CSJ8_MANSE|nr:hypothetical protein O3G_MSEX009761 [Manduca sexta]